MIVRTLFERIDTERDAEQGGVQLDNRISHQAIRY